MSDTWKDCDLNKIQLLILLIIFNIPLLTFILLANIEVWYDERKMREKYGQDI